MCAHISTFCILKRRDLELHEKKNSEAYKRYDNYNIKYIYLLFYNYNNVLYIFITYKILFVKYINNYSC